MRYIKRWMIVVLVTIVGLQLMACSGSTYEFISPIELEPIEGSKYHTLTLTERAVERLGIQTAPLEEATIDGATRMVIPYAALMYDTEGHTFTYVNPEPRTYLKTTVEVEYIDGNQVVLTDGPPLGTAIVTVGLAELYGADTGVGQ